MLVLDAALTGAKGVNSGPASAGPPPQRSARLYTALVERGLASAVSGALLPTADPFLYTHLADRDGGRRAGDARGGGSSTRSSRCATEGITRSRDRASASAAARAARVRERQRDQHRASARLLRDRRGPGLSRGDRWRGSTAVTADEVSARRARPPRARGSDNRLVPADRATGMSATLTRGLSPGPHGARQRRRRDRPADAHCAGGHDQCRVPRRRRLRAGGSDPAWRS